MLIRRCETGKSLPHAPEFGPDGAWPPVVTQWVPLSWALFWTDPPNPELWDEPDPDLSAYPPDPDPDPAAFAAAAILNLYSPARCVEDALRTEDALRDDFLHESAFAWFPEGTELRPFDNDPFFRGLFDPPGELRRAVRSIRWRRKDPVTQLPPGVTYEMTQSVTTGLSVEHSRTLADSLGLSLGGEAAGVQARLTSQVQQEFGLKLDITSQQQHSTKLTLSNSGEDRYRLFAVWYVDHRISVDALALPVEDPAARAPIFRSHSYGFRPAWQPRASMEFAAENDSHMTYTEVGRSL